jgi:hypothetical protein
MSRDFQFKQILRAYRMGIISEATLEQEMKVLENGAQASSNGNGAFKAFGQTYESERAAVMRFLEAVSAAETNGGDLVRAWLAICKTDCIRGGLKMVAERESYHGRAFEQRLKELGGRMPDRHTEEFRKNLANVSDPNTSDLAKLQRGVARFPNPEETIRPLFEFADLIKEDYETKEMVRLFAEDELSTLKWQHSLCTMLTRMQNDSAASAAP